MPELKLYTVADLRGWLMNNQSKDGLSEQVIAPARAWAIIHNPYVKDDDPIASAIFEEGKVVAFTAAFPELIDGQRYWWFSSLWCDPKHQGKGYGLIVIGSLAEVYGEDYILDRWGAQETRDIFSHLGAQIIYTPRYIFGSKINRQTIKGKLVYFVRSLQRGLHKLIEKSTKPENYKLRYLTNIDAETYAFILQHRNQDLFQRTQPMFNWILQYSFTLACPLMERTFPTTPFAPAKALSDRIYAVQVLNGDSLIGFYMMKHIESQLNVLYIYYDVKAVNKVFASVRDHVKRLHVSQVMTDNSDLADYLKREIYFPKHQSVLIHFASPLTFKKSSILTFQYGDGDNFTA